MFRQTDVGARGELEFSQLEPKTWLKLLEVKEEAGKQSSVKERKA